MAASAAKARRYSRSGRVGLPLDDASASGSHHDGHRLQPVGLSADDLPRVTFNNSSNGLRLFVPQVKFNCFF
ncbi:hypothetical protein HPP92_004516 [Vanilla planifolia]|uniref:Uncharacterized protein n=1 Tax=Vanilla planifolia TaxID=51239 RepID=A0A835VCC9_VANPL|nr:hypothetical protein HPP92_004516 [Vanilla planifolia]